MPRSEYISSGGTSLPKELVQAIDRLKKDVKFINEQRSKGYWGKISRAYVMRIALQDLLKSKGYRIGETSEFQDTEPQRSRHK